MFSEFGTKIWLLSTHFANISSHVTAVEDFLVQPLSSPLVISYIAIEPFCYVDILPYSNISHAGLLCKNLCSEFLLIDCKYPDFHDECHYHHIEVGVGEQLGGREIH